VASRIGGRRQQPGGRRLQVPSASSGRRVLGERGELPLACRGARVLVGQEEDGIGDPARVGEGCRRETLPRVDPSSGWMPAATISNATWMARGRLSSAAALVIARPPNDPAAHRPRPGKRAPRRAAGDLHESRCPAVHDREASASGQQGERRAGRSRRPRVKAVKVGIDNRAGAERPRSSGLRMRRPCSPRARLHREPRRPALGRTRSPALSRRPVARARRTR
jgi:hypothetical protein